MRYDSPEIYEIMRYDSPEIHGSFALILEKDLYTHVMNTPPPPQTCNIGL